MINHMHEAASSAAEQLFQQYESDLAENRKRLSVTNDWKEILDLTYDSAVLRFQIDFSSVELWMSEESGLALQKDANAQLGLGSLGRLTQELYTRTDSTIFSSSPTLGEFLRDLLLDSELIKGKVENERAIFAVAEDKMRKEYAMLTRERRLLDGRTDSADELEQAASRLIEEKITEPIKNIVRDISNGAEELLKRRHTLVYALLYALELELASSYGLAIELPQACKDLAELYCNVDADDWAAVESHLPKRNCAVQIVPCSIVLGTILDTRPDLALTYFRLMKNNMAMDASPQLILSVLLANNLIREALEHTREVVNKVNAAGLDPSGSRDMMRFFFSTCVEERLYRKVFTLGLKEREVECMMDELAVANRWDLMVLYHIQHGNIAEALAVYERMDTSSDLLMAPEQRKQLDKIVQSVRKMANADSLNGYQPMVHIPNVSGTEMPTEYTTSLPAPIKLDRICQTADNEVIDTPMDINATPSSRLRKPREIRNVSSTPHRYNSRSHRY